MGPGAPLFREMQKFVAADRPVTSWPCVASSCFRRLACAPLSDVCAIDAPLVTRCPGVSDVRGRAVVAGKASSSSSEAAASTTRPVAALRALVLMAAWWWSQMGLCCRGQKVVQMVDELCCRGCVDELE